ncbi:hypothetical protein CMALT394_130011 [Carnobacterium maltaromaticum]|nr:hypothetical protein CMALT394_130011 [Carnobacterium maltaromaticum]
MQVVAMLQHMKTLAAQFHTIKNLNELIYPKTPQNLTSPTQTDKTVDLTWVKGE